MILKGKLVVIAMVITSLAFVVAAVAASSSVAVSISSLGRRLLKSVRPPPNGLVPPLSPSKWIYPTANSISNNTTKLKEEIMKSTYTQRISIEAICDEESDRGILFAYFLYVLPWYSSKLI
ncbi:MAG: hypothetical protein M3247_04355 [Thermoproteota archaeon]|nr:hypothetical protein [Thermoproteota archaeon]